MALCPFATVRLLPATSPSYTTTRIRATQIIAHSIGDPGATADDLYHYWAGSGSNGDSSHFFISRSGQITQFVDTAFECFASYNGNRRSDGTGSIAFESEDAGDPDTEPWTAAAVASIIRLGLWLVTEHPDITRRPCRTPDDPGLGYHSMWGYNTAAEPQRNPWTKTYGKTCPGLARIPQWQNTIVPAVIAGHAQEDVSIVDAATKAYLDGQFGRVLGGIGIEIYGDNADDSHDAGTHPFNLQALAKTQAQVAGQVAGLATAVAALGNGTVVDMAAVEAAAEKGANDALSHLRVVTDQTPPTA